MTAEHPGCSAPGSPANWTPRAESASSSRMEESRERERTIDLLVDDDQQDRSSVRTHETPPYAVARHSAQPQRRDSAGGPAPSPGLGGPLVCHGWRTSAKPRRAARRGTVPPYLRLPWPHRIASDPRQPWKVLPRSCPLGVLAWPGATSTALCAFCVVRLSPCTSRSVTCC